MLRRLPLAGLVSTSVVVGLVIAIGAIPLIAAGVRAQMSTSAAKVCGLLPLADLEALYGANASPPRGTDGPGLSQCSVVIGTQMVVVKSAPPGTAGVPTSVKAGLAAQQAMPPGRGMSKAEVTDYGDVGCVHSTLTLGSEKPLHSTGCFQVAGGYLHLTLTSEDPSLVSNDHVKDLLHKALARRKG